jgi:hypothetical protein
MFLLICSNTRGGSNHPIFFLRRSLPLAGEHGDWLLQFEESIVMGRFETLLR